MERKICAGVVGAGEVTGIYLKNMTGRFSNLRVKAICSAHFAHAEAMAKQYGIKAAAFEEMLSDKEVELIVNLTPLWVHDQIIRAALEAGKHVYTEKTLTGDLLQAGKLLALARDKHLSFGAAPDTFLGAGIQTAKAAIEDGSIGEVTGFAVTACRDWGELMSRKPSLREPGPGICYDYAVYHVTALAALLGPVDSAAAFAAHSHPCICKNPDSPLYGQELVCPNETRVSALLRMRSGVTGTVMLNGDSIPEDETFFRIYGTKGILELGNPDQFYTFVRLLPSQCALQGTGEFMELTPVNPYTDNARGLGTADLARSILTGEKSRVDARLAYHVQEVLAAILESSRTQSFVPVRSDCPLSEPLRGMLSAD